MKLLFSVFVFVAFLTICRALPKHELRLNLGIHKDKCQAETGATAESIEKIRNHEPVEDDEGKCFKKCMCDNLELCDKEMKIRAEVLLKKKPFLPKEKVLKEIAKCNELKGYDDCDTVFTRYLCFWENVPEVKSHKPW